MPTMRQRITALCVSAGIIIGGAWMASQVPVVEAEEAKAGTMPGLEVTVDGVRNGNGQVIVLIMDNRDAFKAYDYEAAVGYHEIPASTGAIQAFFPDLNSGPYAVVAFHDENGNRDLDMNGQVPSEGYTVSGARDAYDEPPFKRAASSDQKQTVRLFYLK
ncbi:DUF2141 domain-containing protein [Roseibium sp. SCP14]|uniref:DUF2141 domain-containing protein n=1 Tax=Roseibium sp. SCP14 TaxID=3141375 RepID=UPI003337E6F1